eukprot:15343701-Ditylum_brightwellii.AAC.1
MMEEEKKEDTIETMAETVQDKMKEAGEKDIGKTILKNIIIRLEFNAGCLIHKFLARKNLLNLLHKMAL